MSRPPERRALPTALIVLLPFVLLGALLLALKYFDPVRRLAAGFPPIEELTIQRVILEPGEMIVKVVNGGPEPVTVAQVQVDDAYWDHRIEPGRQIPRLGQATITIPYPWVNGEAHHLKLVSSTGLAFEKEIPVAVPSPRPSLDFVLLFALLGVYVGVIPVALGLLWFPALRRVSARWLDFFLFLTIGLLVFLGIDALHEAGDVASSVPGAFQGNGLLALGAIASFALLTALEKSLSGAGGSGRAGGAPALTLAYLVAIGIGLHNLSEGLAIGAAYTLGNVALGAMLVIGFTLHNTTEGLAIVAPVARSAVGIRHLVLLGAIGGVPTILGAWLGGFTYSAVLALLFLAFGAGAIFQVVYQITVQMASGRGGVGALVTFPNVAGFLAGFLVMYGTGLLVAV
ncbi:MAG TPA: ZIP family metal transporter [Candidatus Eisenbacteria bacterium]|jgi:zinc transporter ZupT